MKVTDKRILEFLEKKLEGKGIDIERFLQPSMADFRDAYKLKNMTAAVQKIQTAINEHKKILVYGDYDSDGICASTILYLFFKSKGANVDVFIPSRFENGYGLSIEALEEIQFEYNPDLIVTVDLGITAVEEVEILKQEGIDIVITDHHIPLEEIPDCIVVDPKLESDYGFDALCGAGVAMKLVEAMADRDEANKYLDICAIATIGDIVPLVDENRAIAKLGIDIINSGKARKSINFMLKKLEIEKITSTDVSFKIVPRLNACGRMDNAIKVFEFLIETNDDLLEEKYAEIESDNTLRLASIDKGNKAINKCLEKHNSNEPSVLIQGDFHEGIIGILASRICSEYGKPTIIFTKTEDGTLKGSGRSVDAVDLHHIISGMTDMLVNFGGHKMAVGVELVPEVFEEFKNLLNQKIIEETNEDAFIIKNATYDIKLTEDDLTETFFRELSMLEPFGCENEKPVLMLEQSKMNAEPISEKVFKHYRLFTEKNNAIVAFNAYKNIPILKSNSEKLLTVELGENTFRGKTSLSVTLKNITLKTPDLDGFENDDLLSSLYNNYYSIFDFNNKENYHLTDNIVEEIKNKFAESKTGTLVVCSNNDDISQIKQLGLEEYFSTKTYKNGQNTILVNPRGVYELSDIIGYKNIIFMHKYFNEEHLYFSQKLNVYEPTQKLSMSAEISKDRDVFARVYKLANNFTSLKANDVLDLASKLSLKSAEISAPQILFGLIVFMELNFLEFDEILGNLVILKAKKMELASSKVYNSVE